MIMHRLLLFFLNILLAFSIVERRRADASDLAPPGTAGTVGISSRSSACFFYFSGRFCVCWDVQPLAIPCRRLLIGPLLPAIVN